MLLQFQTFVQKDKRVVWSIVIQTVGFECFLGSAAIDVEVDEFGDAALLETSTDPGGGTG
jgi:hypothetical protein